MPGVRIKHVDGPDGPMTSCTLIIDHPGEPDRIFPGQIVRNPRKAKPYYIRLDADGIANGGSVSETIWHRIQQCMSSGTTTHKFLVLNEVKDPPAITLGFDDPTVPTRHFRETAERAIQEIMPPGVKQVTVSSIDKDRA